MDLMVAAALPIVLITAYLTRRRLGRVAGPSESSNADNVELWERFLRAQRPWEATWLHWVRTPQGERLEGDILPPCGDPPQRRVSIKKRS
ncbi:MAG: hypothetical protein ACRDRZ_15855 [Pseudonocardiaceae bacterium]